MKLKKKKQNYDRDLLHWTEYLVIIYSILGIIYYLKNLLW